LIKSRRVRWARYVACVGQMGNAYKIFIKKLKGRDLVEGLVVDGDIL
jgi:hypothetical protein